MCSRREDEFSNFLGGFLCNALPARTQARCPAVAALIRSAKTGHVGCADCYDVFGGRTLPTYQKNSHVQHIAARTATERFRKPARTYKEEKLLN